LLPSHSWGLGLFSMAVALTCAVLWAWIAPVPMTSRVVSDDLSDSFFFLCLLAPPPLFYKCSGRPQSCTFEHQPVQVLGNNIHNLESDVGVWKRRPEQLLGRNCRLKLQHSPSGSSPIMASAGNVSTRPWVSEQESGWAAGEERQTPRSPADQTDPRDGAGWGAGWLLSYLFKFSFFFC